LVPVIHAGHATATSGRMISPSAKPMRYTRSIARELVDGAIFTVVREFNVSFLPVENGYMLNGQQLLARVDAPPQLAEFATMEEARDESGLFPIVLDSYGQILSADIAQPDERVFGRAVETALGRLTAQPLHSDERKQFTQLLNVIQQAGQHVAAYLPIDLFAPATSYRHDERDIALPGGAHGKVETSFESDSCAITGLMQTARRKVVTQVEATQRATLESWSLSLV
ncbi:MAG: hypothetical protein WA957_00660, partial [Alteraurantiacibacter sp.]